ncbi:methylglyoxal synthase [Streptomyces sp. NBC_00193]|uniref:methylglyoxal synthase n=1 Tax=Streptomyces sp. NBC_00193 TaxID=2975675 RepID=UPI00338DF89C
MSGLAVILPECPRGGPSAHPLEALHRHRIRISDAWRRNHRSVTRHGLVVTTSTARLLRSELGLQIRAVESGPHGGDQQIGSMVISGDVTSLVFFWDPLWAAPHVHDVLALVRIAVIRNIPVALNPASAEAMSEDGFSLESQSAAGPLAVAVRPR